jgi:hypothetical protein
MVEELMKQYSPKQILEAAKKLHKEQAAAKSTWLPSVRCTTTFRQETEQAAAKVDKTITEYIYDAVEDSNKILGHKQMGIDDVAYQLIKDSSLMEILGSKGRIIMLKLSQVCVEQKASKESQKIADEIFKTLNNKNWLAGTMALFFALDMSLQNNPLALQEMKEGEESQAIKNMINTLEKRMQEGGKGREKKEEN